MNKYYKNTKTGRGCSGSVRPEGDHYEEISSEQWRALLKKIQLDDREKNAPKYDKYESKWDEAHTISGYDKVYWSHFTDVGKLVSVFSGGFIRKYNSESADITHGNTPAFIEILKNGDKLYPIDAMYLEPMDIYIMYDGIHRIMAWDSEGQNIRYYDRFPSANIEVTNNYLVQYKEQLELIELGELDSTTITETQYKDILKLRNQWRKELDE